MARIKKSFRLSPDIVRNIESYAQQKGITFTYALERLLVKALESEETTYKIEKESKPIIEEEIIENKELDEDDSAILDMFL